MKLTNINMARALGWTWEKVGQGKDKPVLTLRRKPGVDIKFRDFDKLPNWTESLDAIVAEIEARELPWKLDARDTPFVAQVFAADFKGFADTRFSTARGDTAARALCAALLAYLKDSHDPA